MEYTGGTFNPNGIFYSTFNPETLNVRSFPDTILRLWPYGTAPLYAMTGQCKRTTAVNHTHGYHTKRMAFTVLTVDGLLDGAATTLVVTSTAGVVPGMVFQVPATAENIIVTAVTDATTLTIARSYGRVAAGAVADEAVLFCVGNNHTEASERPVARGVTAEYVPNYTSILRNAWNVSDTARASLTETGDYNNVSENRTDCMQFHSSDIESTLFWSQPQAPNAITGTKLEHSTQGVVDAIRQFASGNMFTADATTTWAQIQSYLEVAFTSVSSLGSPNERVMFTDATGHKVMTALGELYGNTWKGMETTTFGMQFTALRFYKGTVYIKEHPLFNSVGTPAGLAVVLDLPTMAMAYMDGRDVKREEYDGSKDSTGNGVDAVGGSLTTEFATEFKDPGACVVINGLTAAAAA